MSRATIQQLKTAAPKSDHIEELLQTMETAGMVEQYLNKDGEKCFRLTDKTWTQLDEEK